MVQITVCIITALVAFASATDVEQCSGKSFPNLSNNVQLTPCKKAPCRLKKGTSQHVSITFVPETDVKEIKNHVSAEVFGVPLPFIGVDGVSICEKLQTEDGQTASCPLTAGTTYVYKDSFPVLKIYPNLSVKVHWALTDGVKDVMCFEVPARIS